MIEQVAQEGRGKRPLRPLACPLGGLIRLCGMHLLRKESKDESQYSPD